MSLPTSLSLPFTLPPPKKKEKRKNALSLSQYRQCSIYHYHETELPCTLEAEEVSHAYQTNMSPNRGH
eukprot:c41455_g1_i1 orf=2-202(-)